MRIGLVSLHTSPVALPGTGDAGGMNVVVAAHARALAQRGHEVVMVTRAQPGLAAGSYPQELPRIARRDVGAASVNDRPHPGSITLVALPAGKPALRKEELPAVLPTFAERLVDLGTFDAIHAHYWLSGIAAQAAARDSSISAAVTLHTVAAQKNAHLAQGDTPEPDIRLEAEQRLTEQSFVIAGSHSELASITQHYGAPQLGSQVIHPGVDTELFAPQDSQLHTAENPRLRLTVLGRVQPLKGQDLAVRAAGQLARLDPELWGSCELVIAGEPTPGAESYAVHLRQLAADLGISDRVVFLPAQSRANAAALLASSDAVIVPSHSETFGLVALEAAACGVPTVVAAHTGLIEAAPKNVTSVHVAGREPRVWADALRALLTDPERRRALGVSARNYALTHNWEAQARLLEARYRKLS